MDFIWFIGVMSTAIGLINLFPIPVLDGGHLVFIAFEAVTRKASQYLCAEMVNAGRDGHFTNFDGFCLIK